MLFPLEIRNYNSNLIMQNYTHAPIVRFISESHTSSSMAQATGKEEEEQKRKQIQLIEKIVRIFEETRTSHAAQIRKLKELSNLFRSSSAKFLSTENFFAAFSKALTPLFEFSRRTASAERIIKFVASFATFRCEKSPTADIDEFLELFLGFLIVAASAANKNARLRACQIISEIIIRLPDDTEVSNELWDEVIECMKLRVNDKVPAIRAFAVRALSRFLNDLENSDILELFLDKLPLEQSSDVRKAIVLSLPPSNATLAAIIECTLDVSEPVRRAVYCVLATKFPLQSLSIKMRALILQRGLADRSSAVVKDCFKMMKDEWLVKCCNGDPIELLKFLDVETYEVVGESVMSILHKAGSIKLEPGHGLQQFVASSSDAPEGECKNNKIQLMEPEVALFWRNVCKHLQMEAQAKGSDAATTMGSESVVYAEEASSSNDLLDQILPPTVSQFVELVRAHILAGPNYRFACRQLLLLGACLGYSDATNRKVAAEFVQELLHQPLDEEIDENGNEVFIGDGINLGGDKDWAVAVSELARKVHASSGEFDEVVLGVVVELAQPCRERTADWKQWLHCLAVTGLLLENVQSFYWMQRNDFEPAEILRSLLLPGARHAHLDVQRAAIRCLGIFGLLERRPSEDLVKQLRNSFANGPQSVMIMASRALLDLGLWHSPREVDKALNQDLTSQFCQSNMNLNSNNLFDVSELLDMELLDLLYAGMERHCNGEPVEADANDSVQAIIGEGFAKLLLLSEKYPNSDPSSHPFLLAKLISLYFSTDNRFQRLKQCLYVFFEHYPSLSIKHKKCLLKAFMPVMRCLWPGVNENAKRNPAMVANMRKRAAQASRFMLQMMQAPLYGDKGAPTGEDLTESSTNSSADLLSGEEGLAILIAAEVFGFSSKKTAAEKSYVSALCRIIVLLHFRASEQGPIKLMQQLLSCIIESVAVEKDLVKELRQMSEKLKAIDKSPEEKLSSDQANLILGRLESEIKLEDVESMVVSSTPMARSVRSRGKKRTTAEESSSDDEPSPTSVVPANMDVPRTCPQRASKTAAMSKMNVNDALKIDEFDEEDVSDITCDDDSDASE